MKSNIRFDLKLKNYTLLVKVIATSSKSEAEKCATFLILTAEIMAGEVASPRIGNWRTIHIYSRLKTTNNFFSELHQTTVSNNLALELPSRDNDSCMVQQGKVITSKVYNSSGLWYACGSYTGVKCVQFRSKWSSFGLLVSLPYYGGFFPSYLLSLSS